MDEEQIRKLEPKYTGNMRHLTEGEAYAIVNDPNYEGDDDDSLLESIPGILLAGKRPNRPQ
ncbi:hypothetical protein FE784_33660 [Paenibacillus hemerocallicola]|jgi:hypothetical protein|uniref:Uncharacterized protein n=1 Tax=Paenibacillus hemerocallicola TaxID=1172614 RepID=A0A5C4T0R6_9BACL|nr:hypothetical protein [Paenibacillus hemerocallicola]TNJ61837.1 hypothetical protein FE784_33660 [Paenibacillus hemerocallicola]